ncbi:nitroreductase/quinone reductase family protein [Kitasatospora sp. NPDC059577]|uniref:nitroreductase/quinone reductase family protein n=1 Tax=Kitasatospora sp. NPDC059577 TaxID=3346873 RepID=UPI0036C932A7
MAAPPPAYGDPPHTHAPSFDLNVIEEFRTNSGRVGGPFEGGDLLLTTTGARSGRPHTVPLGYVRANGLLLLVASTAGAPAHPQWYRNLPTHPVVRGELGTDTFDAIAVPAEGERRQRPFAAVARKAPGYGDYQAHTERELPVVVLEGKHPGAPPATPHGGAPAVRTLADKLPEAHTWLRAQLRHIREQAHAHLPGRPAGLGPQLRHHCLAFCDGPTHHHTGEDTATFPALARNHPDLGDVLARLDEQHRAIGRIKEELVALLAGIEVTEPERLHAEPNRMMSAELEAHLDLEEAELLPVLAGIPFPPTGRSQVLSGRSWRRGPSRIGRTGRRPAWAAGDDRARPTGCRKRRCRRPLPVPLEGAAAPAAGRRRRPTRPVRTARRPGGSRPPGRRPSGGSSRRSAGWCCSARW